MGRELYSSFVWCLLGVFSFSARLILGEDVWLVPYQRNCRIGRHWAGVDFFFA